MVNIKRAGENIFSGLADYTASSSMTSTFSVSYKRDDYQIPPY